MTTNSGEETPLIEEECLNAGIDKTDVGAHTFLRLWQVISNVIANGSNSDAENPNSSFNRTVEHYSPMAYSLGMLSFFIGALGAYLEYRVFTEKEKQRKTSFLSKQIQGINPTVTETEIGQNLRALQSKVTQKNDVAKTPNQPADLADKMLGFVKATWDFLGKTALIFWPVWMTAVLITGITAISFPPVLPIVIAITFGTSIAIQAGLALAKKRAQTKQDNNTTSDSENYPDEVKQRAYLRYEQATFRVAFLGDNKVPPHQSKERSAPAKKDRATDEDVKNSLIGKRLLGKRWAHGMRTVATMFNEAIGNYTLAAFVLWLLSSTAAAFAPVAAVFGTLAAVLGGSALFATFSTAFGLLQSVLAKNKLANERIAHDQKVLSQLAQPYRKLINDKTFLKHEVFDHYFQLVEELKKDPAVIGRLHLKKNLIRNKARANLTNEDKYILNYELKNIDVYKKDLRENQPSAWVSVKNALFVGYKAVNAGQTWIFVSRSLLLTGAVGAGLCFAFGPAAGIAFIAMALTLAAVGIVSKLTQMYLDGKAERNTNCIETIDARISYLKKKYKQLQALKDGHLPYPTSQDNPPCPGANNPSNDTPSPDKKTVITQRLLPPISFDDAVKTINRLGLFAVPPVNCHGAPDKKIATLRHRHSLKRSASC